ncbi:hypothetical protein WMY93_022948 [Mugilogobius chulae]|uniref:Endonuclease VIII-like 1 DNA binding domain-containing protein n=1 Tax=Mugilogobius chulae TaxID=88201 RepID=A0AAW0NDY4_9GOBI
MFEYKSFRENVLSRLSDHAFDKPICEVLLNQKYFNGIGNYLRAEILYRLNIPPFECARTVLKGLDLEDVCETKQLMADAKKHVKQEAPDLLRLCHTVPLEVVNMGGKGYDPEKADYSDFEAWLQCYYVDGMKSLRDNNGRTIWFSGNPGPMAPKGAKSPKAKKRIKKEEDDHDYPVKKKPAKSRSGNTTEKKAIKKENGIKRQIKKEKDAESGRRKVGKVRKTGVNLNKKSQTVNRKKKNTATPAADSQKENRRRTRQSRK